MKNIIPFCLLSVLSVATLFAPAFAKGDETDKPGLGPADPETETLIGELASVSEKGIGYGTTFSGAQFLPDKNSKQPGAFILGTQPPVESSVMEKIVRRGAVAVPSLLQHLGDAQETKIPAIVFSKQQYMMWWDFADEYDYNRRTKKTKPLGVNQDTSTRFDRKQPDRHTITVGDLCFVALGQIVNRNFNAMRYQPTGGTIINSPSYSVPLRVAAEADFKNFTQAEHRELLTRDFLEPDYEDRRVGALRRLAFYYPELLEPLILKQLAVPTYDVFKIENFVRQELYPEKSQEKRKAMFADFLKNNGQAFSDGIELQLFDDLDTQEADEQGRRAPPLKKGEYDARALLIQLYGFKDDVNSQDKPYVDTWDWCAQARFIDGMAQFKNARVDDAVYGIFSKIKGADDYDYLAISCMKRLVGGKHDQEFREYCERRIPLSKYESAGLLSILKSAQ